MKKKSLTYSRDLWVVQAREGLQYICTIEQLPTDVLFLPVDFQEEKYQSDLLDICSSVLAIVAAALVLLYLKLSSTLHSELNSVAL